MADEAVLQIFDDAAGETRQLALVDVKNALADAITETGGLGEENVLTASEPGTSVLVATTSTQVAAAKPNRRYLSITNPSDDTDAWLRFGASAALMVGQWLPSGSTWTMPEKSILTAAVNAIGQGASVTLTVVEW